jgi:hypothetical protein
VEVEFLRAKAYLPIAEMLFGIVSAVSEEQFSNAYAPISSVAEPKVMAE